MGEQVRLLLHFPPASSVAFSELMKGRPEHSDYGREANAKDQKWDSH